MKKEFKKMLLIAGLICGMGVVSKMDLSANIGLAVAKEMFKSDNEYVKTGAVAAGGGAGAAAGAWAGAKAGAAIGCVGGPAGAVIGGVVGGVAGSL